MFYFYGILFNIIGFGFYFYYSANSSVYDSSLKTAIKFIFSVSTAWLLVLLLTGADIYDISFSLFVKIVFVITPLVSFIGFQLWFYLAILDNER